MASSNVSTPQTERSRFLTLMTTTSPVAPVENQKEAIEAEEPQLQTLPTEILELLYPHLEGIFCAGNANHASKHEHSLADGCYHWPSAFEVGYGLSCPATCRECIYLDLRRSVLALIKLCRRFKNIYQKYLYSDIRAFAIPGNYEVHSGRVKQYPINRRYKASFEAYCNTVMRNEELMQRCKVLRMDFYLPSHLRWIQNGKQLFTGLRSLTITNIAFKCPQFLVIGPFLQELTLYRESFSSAVYTLKAGFQCHSLRIKFDDRNEQPRLRPPHTVVCGRFERPSNTTSFKELTIERLSGWPQPAALYNLLYWTHSLQSFSLQLNRAPDHDWILGTDFPIADNVDQSRVWSYSTLRKLLRPHRLTLRKLRVVDFGPNDPANLSIADFPALEELHINFPATWPSYCEMLTLNEFPDPAVVAAAWLPPSLSKLVLELPMLIIHRDSSSRQGNVSSLYTDYARGWVFGAVHFEWLTAVLDAVNVRKERETLSLRTIELRYNAGEKRLFREYARFLAAQNSAGTKEKKHGIDWVRTAAREITAKGYKAEVPDVEVPGWYVEKRRMEMG